MPPAGQYVEMGRTCFSSGRLSVSQLKIYSWNVNGSGGPSKGLFHPFLEAIGPIFCACRKPRLSGADRNRPSRLPRVLEFSGEERLFGNRDFFAKRADRGHQWLPAQVRVAFHVRRRTAARQRGRRARRHGGVPGLLRGHGLHTECQGGPEPAALRHQHWDPPFLRIAGCWNGKSR